MWWNFLAAGFLGIYALCLATVSVINNVAFLDAKVGTARDHRKDRPLKDFTGEPYLGGVLEDQATSLFKRDDLIFGSVQ